MHLRGPLQLTAWLLAVALLASGPVAAEEEKPTVLIGRVRARELRAPLQGVLVTLELDYVQEQSVETDADGTYRLVVRKPGSVYAVHFEHPSYRPYIHRAFHARPGRKFRLNVDLDPWDTRLDPFAPMERPGVDLYRSTTGVAPDLALLSRLAVNPPTGPGGAARSFESLAELAPGAWLDINGVSLQGATPFENAFLVDGLSTTDPLSGLNASPLSIEFLKEVRVLTAGYMPEYGRAFGGIIEATTPTGSLHGFQGTVFTTWTPGPLEGPRTPGGGGALKNLGDFGATLSGPIGEEGPLSFFVGVAPALSRVERPRDPGRPYTDERLFQAFAKLTYRLDTHHDASLSLHTAPSHAKGVGPEGTPPGEREGNFTAAALQYRGIVPYWDVVLDANLGWSRGSVVREPPEGTASAPRAWERYQARVHATSHVSDDHGPGNDLKAGLDAEWVTAGPTSLLFGGFVQDSLYLAHRFTLNAGLRYDVQSVDVGGQRFTLEQLSPRVGLFVFPLDADDDAQPLKLFAHYARYTAPVPLALVDPASAASGGAVPQVDPALAPQASHEVVVGSELRVPGHGRLGATWTHRALDAGLALMRREDGAPLLLGNPGLGLASDVPEAARTYDALTVALSPTHEGPWHALASYTLSRLRGNYTGPLWASAERGEPVRLSDFDDPALVERLDGPLPYGRTHLLKLFGARDFALSQKLSANLGLSYQGASGMLPRGATERTPWLHTVDAAARVGFQFREGYAYRTVTFTLDVFNLFNFQEVAWVEGARSQYQAPRQVRLGVGYVF